MGVFSTEIQKSVSFRALMTDDLIRNLKLHIVFSPGILESDMQSLNLEIYGWVFNPKSKKHIISRLNDRHFDTQSKIAYYFLALNPYK